MEPLIVLGVISFMAGLLFGGITAIDMMFTEKMIWELYCRSFAISTACFFISTIVTFTIHFIK